MKDRVSQKPGRVTIIPENGQPQFTAIMRMADDPLDEGTPLNKATLLSDKTAQELVLLPETATPDQAFHALNVKVESKASETSLSAVATKANQAKMDAETANNTANTALQKANAALPAEKAAMAVVATSFDPVKRTLSIKLGVS